MRSSWISAAPTAIRFSITANLPLEKITAIRLEALTHNSLPQQRTGPGHEWKLCAE